MRDAIAAGIFNDLGSGTNVDLCVITKDGAQMLRPYDVANVKGARYVRIGMLKEGRGTACEWTAARTAGRTREGVYLDVF